MQGKTETRDYSSEKLSEKEHVLKGFKVNDMEIVQQIRKIVGVPATPVAQVSRKDLNLPDDYFIHIDVGGEGYNEHEGHFSGFNTSINLNAMNSQSNDYNVRIPNLVRINRWSINTTYPFADGFADYITMQNAPATLKNIEEIARCLRPGGKVELWVADSFKNNIALLAEKLNSKPEYDIDDEFKGSTGSKKVRIVSGIELVAQQTPGTEESAQAGVTIASIHASRKAHYEESSKNVLLLNSLFCNRQQKLLTELVAEEVTEKEFNY